MGWRGLYDFHTTPSPPFAGPPLVGLSPTPSPVCPPRSTQRAGSLAPRASVDEYAHPSRFFFSSRPPTGTVQLWMIMLVSGAYFHQTLSSLGGLDDRRRRFVVLVCFGGVCSFEQKNVALFSDRQRPADAGLQDRAYPWPLFPRFDLANGVSAIEHTDCVARGRRLSSLLFLTT